MPQLRDTISAVEIDVAKLQEMLSSCLETVRQGQPHIVLQNGEPIAAVISMADYETLQRLKVLLEKRALELLQC